jgi:hypothetical protein
MKQTLRALSLGLLLSIGSSDAAKTPLIPDNIDGTPPPAFVTHWTRLSVLGQRTILYMVIWISPQAFARTPFEWLLVLRPDEYGGVQSSLDLYPCADPKVGYPELHALQVSKYEAGKGQTNCQLSAKSSCDYLRRLASLPGIRGIAKKEELLRDFADEIDCT